MMLIDFLFAILCGFTLLVAFQPLCDMGHGWKGGCIKLKYMALTACSFVAANIFISMQLRWQGFAVWLTIFLCLWPRILWWVRNDFLDFLLDHSPRLYHAIAPQLLNLLERMFGR